jgi:hypothetical protein
VYDVEQIGTGRHTDGNGIILDNNPEVPFTQQLVVKYNNVHDVGSDAYLFFNIDDFVFKGNHARDYGQDETMPAWTAGAVEFRNSTGIAIGNSFDAPDGHPEVVYVGTNHIEWD